MVKIPGDIRLRVYPQLPGEVRRTRDGKKKASYRPEWWKRRSMAYSSSIFCSWRWAFCCSRPACLASSNSTALRRCWAASLLAAQLQRLAYLQHSFVLLGGCLLELVDEGVILAVLLGTYALQAAVGPLLVVDLAVLVERVLLLHEDLQVLLGLGQRQRRLLFGLHQPLRQHYQAFTHGHASLLSSRQRISGMATSCRACRPAS